ncbi:MAG: LysR family transcriptional regulator [Telmatospirillum sp.]|nr:LysR family transcriptional regulator [Telmatospirillum sp.]
MKFQHLRFFCAVVEQQSVTAASDCLHISQPAISAGLKALEDELGRPLFDRSGGRQRVIPTRDALRFYEDARDILERCEQARAIFQEPKPRADVIRVGVLRTLAAGTVEAALTIAAGTPGPLWSIREGSPAEMTAWLAQDRIDIAWTTIETPSATSMPLWTEPFVVMVAPGHRLAALAGTGVRPADLEDEPAIGRTSCEMRSGTLRRSGIRLRMVARVAREDLVLRLVAKGVGIAIAPASLAAGDVVAVPFDDADLTRTIGLRWRKDLPDATVGRVSDILLRSGSPDLPR